MRGKRMVQWLAGAAALLLCAVMPVSCGGRGGKNLSESAARQLEEIRKVELPSMEREGIVEPEWIELFGKSLEHYERSGKILASPDEPGILSLACLFKKRELVRCLLAQGADPNAHATGAEESSPLLLAVGTYLLPGATTEQIIPVVDTLLEGGADFKKSGNNATDFFTLAAFACEREDVLLHLLDKGAQPDADSAFPAALHGWNRMLERLLPITGNHANLLGAVATGCCQFEGNYPACLDLLLENGADIHASESADNPGSTVLFRLAAAMSDLEEDSPRMAQALDVFVYLHQKGADPFLRANDDKNFPGFSPYDFLASRPSLLEKLRERGVVLQAPALLISVGKSLLADVCRAVMYKAERQQITPFREAIAAVLRPSPEMRSADIYPQALEAAVSLLASIDPAKAAQDITEMPLWQHAVGAEDAESILPSLLAALQDTPSIVLPAEFLRHQAERVLKAGLTDEASVLIELIGRCEDSRSILQQCAEDSRPAMQAGAYAALLHLEGLPDARNDGVSSWLAEHDRAADSDFLKEAVLLTSPERLWFGDMKKEEIRQFTAALRRLGASRAADAYEQIAAALNNPEKLDTLMAQSHTWRFESEVAIARYFLENKEKFQSTPTTP